jgi:hypothetical protein
VKVVAFTQSERSELIRRAQNLRKFSGILMKSPACCALLAGGSVDALAISSAARRFLMVELSAPAVDRIHVVLRRRIEACQARRKEAALSPGNDEDFAIWTRECARGDKLVRALTAHLSHVPFVFTIRSPQPAMSTATEDETMSKKQLLSPATVSSILSHGTWQGSDKVRIVSTLRNDPVLRKAGVHDPRPLESYDVPVKRDARGLLVIDHDAHTPPPVAASDDSLFESGGLFANQDRPNVVDFIPAASVSDEIQPVLDALCEIPATRTFEITIDSHRKIRVQVCGFEDQALPSPSEPERWKPRKPSNVDVHAAISALHMARELAHFEQL